MGIGGTAGMVASAGPALVAAVMTAALVAARLVIAALMRAAVLPMCGRAPFGRFGPRPFAGTAVGRGDRHPDQPFDVAQEGALNGEDVLPGFTCPLQSVLT